VSDVVSVVLDKLANEFSTERKMTWKEWHKLNKSYTTDEQLIHDLEDSRVKRAVVLAVAECRKREGKESNKIPLMEQQALDAFPDLAEKCRKRLGSGGEKALFEAGTPKSSLSKPALKKGAKSKDENTTGN